MAQTHDIEWYLAQVRRIAEHREKGAEKEIRKLYKEMLKDLQSFIGTQYALLAEDDQLTYGILQAKGEAARFLEEVEANINSVSPKVQRQIRDVVEQTYTAAYTGMFDAVEKAHNLEELRINLDGIRGTTPETVKKAVENPVSGLTLSDTLEKHRKEVIYEIKRQIGVGLIAGDRYSTMARRISDQLDMDYRKSIRIVRTETHRVREAGTQEGAIAVQEKLKNADSEYRLVKIWRTMKDERVRPQRKAYKRKAGVKARKQYTAGLRSSLSGPNHMKMEGQTVLLDEPFDLGGGVKAMVPGSSGVAGHDINCRCYTSEKLMNDEEFFKATGKHFPKDSKTSLENADTVDIINDVEMFKKKVTSRTGFKPISDTRFNELTIESRKNGAIIIRGTDEVEKHLESRNAYASTVGNVLMFRKDATVGDVLEETHHFMQNINGLNDDKGEPLRTYLNEIDAKKYIIENASKLKVPRNEVELAQRELEHYKKLLNKYNRGNV